MNQKKNRLPQGFGVNPLHCQQRGNPKTHQPGVMQPKMAMALQMMKKPPVPPPVYRPQPVPRVLQTKSAFTHHPPHQTRTAPITPPVYRPQPVPKVLQTRMASAQRSQAGKPPRQPAAPPVYRPEQKRVQPKIATVASIHTIHRSTAARRFVSKVLQAKNSNMSRLSFASARSGTIQCIHPHPHDVGRDFLIRHPYAHSSTSVGTYQGPNNDGSYQFTTRSRGFVAVTHDRIISYRPTVGLMHPQGMSRPVEEQVEGRSEVFLSEADLSGVMARQRRDPSLLERMVVTTFEAQPDYPDYEQNVLDLQSQGVPILNSFDISDPNSSQRLSLLEPNSNIHFQMPRVPRISGYSTQQLISDTLNMPHEMGRHDLSMSITTPHPTMYNDASIHNRHYGLESGKTFGENEMFECHTDSDDDLEDYGYTHKQSTKNQSAEVAAKRKKYKFRPKQPQCNSTNNNFDNSHWDRDKDDDDFFGGGPTDNFIVAQ